VEFLQPLALFALAGAAVPALLHLLQRRTPPTLVFPAVRYLVDAEQRHSRQLRLRNLLLLILRTFLIAALALAAARPVVPAPFGGTHAPSAVVVVLDNSPSSSAVVGGRPVLDRLLAAARAVGERAAAGDRLWLLTADGIPRPVAPGAWSDALSAIAPMTQRLDLGRAVRSAATILDAEELPGSVVVLSDLQETAVGEASVRVPVTVLSPNPGPPNRGIETARAEPDVWSPGGEVTVQLGGATPEPGEIVLEMDGRPLARGFASPGEAAILSVDRIPLGWHAARAVLQPDEFRADDVRHVALRGGPPPAVSARGAGAFVDAALAVLAQTGRVRSGQDVLIGDRPAAGSAVVLPPGDPAEVGALNRTLGARGVPVRFGQLREGEWPLASAVFTFEHTAVRRRYVLEGDAAVLATAGGDPWIVRHGNTVVVASRLEEGWTDLPLRPAFVPFMDALLSRSGAPEAWRADAEPGAEIRLPGSARRLLLPHASQPVSADRSFGAPAVPGVYFVAGPTGDTVGALVVNLDPRESDLRTASRAAVVAAFGSSTIFSDVDKLGTHAYSVRRAELTTLLLVVTLLLAALEMSVASVGGARRTAEA
jgi:Aerotolerance regulator N-terminal